MKKQALFIARIAAITASLAAATAVHAADTAKTVKVFLLAGQSNMEGKAPNALLDYQAEDPQTKGLFQHLRQDGKWIVRDDVFIKFLERKGPLTVGYGSPGCTGAELEFGWMMGDHFDEPVVLVKAAWGGHSLFQQFCSPSRFPEEKFQQALATWEKAHEAALKKGPVRWRDPGNERFKPSPYGTSYRAMLAEVKETFDKYETLFPALKGRKLELAGFVWFQGWNDQYGGAEKEYASNMQCFIKDVRKDLGAPNLPFVIAAMGQNGSKPAAGPMLTIREAQMSMNDVPEFKGNVKAFRTDVLVDKAAEELFPNSGKNEELWKKTGGDAEYHYYGSPIWFTRIGHAMGEAMLELMTGFRQQNRRPELAPAAMNTAMPAALADRISPDVTKLERESVAESLRKLSDVNMFHWPSSSLVIDDKLPLGADQKGQSTVEAMMSNRRTRKILDDLSGMDKAAASQLVSNEFSAAIDEYLPLYDRSLRGLDSYFSTNTFSANQTNQQRRALGISFAVSNVPEGQVVISGAQLKVLTLVWVSGLLQLDTRAQVERVALLARKQRQDLYAKSPWDPVFIAQMLHGASLYNRQILGSGLVGLGENYHWETSSLKADGVQWVERTLASYRAAMTEYNLPVRSGAMQSDYSRGSRTVKFLSPLNDVQFDTIMREMHLIP